MASNGDDSTRGTALLIAATPGGKGCLMDAAAVLPALAAVPPDVLTGTAGASVVELADPADPQVVLTRLRTAAASPGPLLVHLIGRLTLDRKQQLPHLALVRTTPMTVRYTAFPWHWLAAELAHRPLGTTAVLADLVADTAAWTRLQDRPDLLWAGLPLYGTVAPPPPRRTLAAPHYSRAVADLLRAATARLPLGELHDRAVALAALEGTGRILLTPPGTAPGRPSGPPRGAAAAAPGGSPRPAGAAQGGGGDAARDVPPLPAAPPAAPPPPAPERPDPHPAILTAAREGRHREAAAMAAAWEQQALRTHGADSGEAVHWLEVRADLARLAGAFDRSCELWTAAAFARLRRGEPVEAPDVVAAVDRAHHCWEQVGDAAAARELGGRLLEARRRVPSPRPGAVPALERRLAALGGGARTG